MTSPGPAMPVWNVARAVVRNIPAPDAATAQAALDAALSSAGFTVYDSAVPVLAPFRSAETATERG